MKYIKYKGVTYRAVDGKGDFLKDTRKIKEVEKMLGDVVMSTWWQGLDASELAEVGYDSKEAQAEIKRLVSVMKDGQSKLRQAQKLVTDAASAYAQLEKEHARFLRNF